MAFSSSCLDADTLVAYVDHALSNAQRLGVEAHVDLCEECRWLLYELARSGAPDVPAAHEDPGGVLPAGMAIGPYVVERPLGAGGMGLVYAARDPRLGRDVALKAVRPLPDSGPGSKTPSLADEAQAMAKVAHPNVTSVYDLIEHRGRSFVIMELVLGTDLRTWLSGGPRRASEILDVFLQAGEGLAAIHDAGLWHRDFKPSNVLVGDDGRVRVSDFGLAHRSGSGEAACAQSDQRAFALSLREALAGARVHDARASRALARRLETTLARACDPAAGFSSMPALLASLRSERRSPWPRWLSLATVAFATIVGVIFVRGTSVRAAMEACVEGGDAAPVWDAPRKEAARASILAGQEPYAASSWASVDAALEGWSKSYATQRRAACAATWERGVQSRGDLAIRLDCLADRKREARSVASVLSHEGARLARTAVASAMLTSPDVCDEAAITRKQPAVPHDAAAAREVNAVRETLAWLAVMERAGRHHEVISVARDALRRAEATGFLPLVAEASYALGSLETANGEAARGVATLERAIGAADMAGDDALRGRAWIRMMRIDYEAARLDRMDLAQHEAAAALTRANAAPMQWADLHQAAGALLIEAGRLDEADAELARALSLRAAAGATGALPLLSARAARNVVRGLQGDTPGAVVECRAIVVALDELLGERHPRTAMARVSLGEWLVDDERSEEALPVLEGALAVIEASDGGDHLHTAVALDAIGMALRDQGEPARALAVHDRELAILDSIAVEHPRSARALLGRGESLLALHRHEEASAALRTALARVQASRHPTDGAFIRLALARAASAAGREEEARALAAEAKLALESFARTPRARRHLRVANGGS